MTKEAMAENTEDPHSSTDPSRQAFTDPNKSHPRKTGFGGSLLRRFFKNKGENGHDSLREAIEEAIEQNAQEFDDSEPGSERERLLISNILNLRDLTALDVMIPRADIAAIDINASTDELMKILHKQGYVYSVSQQRSS